jgi:uncharacterized protein YecE (DUF72 family)
MASHPILVGTCGWSYKDWDGVFYPKGLAAGDYLAYVAERFGLVEVDSTFYHAPRPALVDGWRDKTPAGFRFALKVPQSITHEKVLLDCQGEVDGFLSAACRLGDKLACCVLQFGYFNKTAFATMGPFLERLQSFLDYWPATVPLALEIRNKTWVGAQLLECLRPRKIAFVLTDQAWMPSPLSLIEKLDVVTGPFAYVRLLGDRKAVDDLTETLDHVVIDRSQQILDDAKAIRLLSKQVPVIVAVNNHFSGYAPETIRELLQALGNP